MQGLLLHGSIGPGAFCCGFGDRVSRRLADLPAFTSTPFYTFPYFSLGRIHIAVVAEKPREPRFQVGIIITGDQVVG